MGFTVVRSNITGQQIIDGSVGAVDLANGSVGAEKLVTELQRKINVGFNNTTYFGVCETSSNDINKIVSIPDLSEVVEGTRVTVLFVNPVVPKNTSTNLAINGIEGAILVNGSDEFISYNYTTKLVDYNGCVDFIYYNESWICIQPSIVDSANFCDYAFGVDNDIVGYEQLTNELRHDIEVVISKANTTEPIASSARDLAQSLQTQLAADEAEASSIVVDLIADFVVQPVIEGVTDKIVIKRYLPAAKYCIYAGNTPLSDTPLPLNKATVTATGAFEGNVISARFYDDNDNELGRTELVLVSVLNQSVGRFSLIEDTTEENNTAQQTEEQNEQRSEQQSEEPDSNTDTEQETEEQTDEQQ